MSKQLTPHQRDLVEECFYRKRSGESYTDIAKSFGINRRTLFVYRNTEQGQEIEKELRQNLIKHSYEAIMETVIDKALQGSHQHAKLFMQFVGKPKEEEKKEIHWTERIAKLDKILKEEKWKKETRSTSLGEE
ncbi:hypothetical protein JCR32_02815 [Bacillus sp. HNR-4]|uniref:hypothetical protein n=1 Tax=Bacillus TaxID=1386 RepID=UPI001F5A88CF|nr:MULTISPECIES: hypothetical protein [Bacillus]WDL92794.1 hypothetical protein JCR32_02815 [Bacillus sp. HNR-4]